MTGSDEGEEEGKQSVVNEIADLCGLPPDPLGPGSKEHRPNLAAVASLLGLQPEGSKPELAARIVEALGGEWDESCASRGSTVTLVGLQRVRDGLLRYLGVPRESADFAREVRSANRTGALRSPPTGSQSPQRKETTQTAYERDPRVAAWALRIACGRCMRCGEQAPFLDAYGEPFLEVHHIDPLSNGGPDTPENTVALCPNCHRRAHYGSDREAIRQSLKQHAQSRGGHSGADRDE